MSLKEQVYSVLVVSSAESFNNAVSSMLPEASYKPIVFSGNIADAQRKVAQRDYDFIIVNSPLADDLGIRFSIDCSTSRGAIVLLLVRNEIHPETYAKVSPHGVFTLPKPMSVQAMRTALKWAQTAKELTKRYEKKTTSIEARMKEIRLINKAKWLLISNENMSEPEAHKYLEKTAMDRCIVKSQLAEEIIEKYE
jgi:response regulator NasT